MSADETQHDDHPPVEQQEPGGRYVVVARRYRPQNFDQLIGQQQVATALTNAINTDRVGHAYLFTGARGVGKTSAARILAKSLNCHTGPSPTPCDECDICLGIASGGDVDVLEIDGASNRGIDEIRQLRSNVNVRPSRARYKIYIIDEVHMLTPQAFNALLKTLEEPPEHVKFIFCTTDPEKIPITVLSRCQRFDFAGIRTEMIVERLRQIVEAEGAEAEDEALQLLARRAAGSMRDSQSLLEQLLAFGSGRLTADGVHAVLGTAGGGRLNSLVEHLLQRNAPGVVGDLDAALSEGVDAAALIDQLLGCFRDMLAVVDGCPPNLLLHTTPADQEQLGGLAAQTGIESLLAMVQILDQTLVRMRQSTHERTLLEVALVRICQLEDLDTLADTLATLRSGASSPAKSGRPQPAIKKKIAETVIPTDSAAVPAAADGSAALLTLSADTAQQVWQAAITRLDGIFGEYATRAEHVATFAPNQLVVSFPARYNSCKSFCDRQDRRKKLEEVLAHVTGRQIHLQLELLDEQPADKQPPNRPKSRQQMIHEVTARPLVRQALELFDAEVTRVDESRGHLGSGEGEEGSR